MHGMPWQLSDDSSDRPSSSGDESIRMTEKLWPIFFIALKAEMSSFSTIELLRGGLREGQLQRKLRSMHE